MKYTEEMLKEAVKNSESFSGVLRYLNAGLSGSNHGHIKRRIQKYGIDYSHFGSSPQVRGIRSSVLKTLPSDILIILPESTYKRPTRRRLMFAMLSEGLPYLCAMEECPSPDPTWRKTTLPLEIDHINGNWRDCTLTNLRFLCPNCHSQTASNYRSKAIGPEELQYTLDVLEGKDVEEPDSVQKRRKSKNIYDTCSCGGVKTKTAMKCFKCFDRSAPRGFTVKYPEIEVLVEEVRETSYLAVGKRLGCSDNAVRKRIKTAGYDPKTLQLLDKVG